MALDERLRERGFVSLLIVRLVPLFPFNGVNFGCGLTSLRTRDYVLATALGILGLGERPKVRVFLRFDKFDRYVSALVYVPRERFNTAGTDERGRVGTQPLLDDAKHDLAARRPGQPGRLPALRVRGPGAPPDAAQPGHSGPR